MMYGIMVWWVWYLLPGGVDGLSGYGPSMRFGALDCAGSDARAVQLEKEKFEFLRLEEKISTVSENKALEAEGAARLIDSTDGKKALPTQFGDGRQKSVILLTPASSINY
jgi:hypothetical protein